MKFVNRFLALALIVITIAACDKIDENLNNPTEVTPEGAQIDDVYNSVQLAMRNLMNNSWYWTASLTRMTANTSSYDYLTASNPNSFNGIWNTVYAGMWSDIEVVELLAADKGLDIHSASSKIMKAYSMMLLVDVFGDVPYTESLQGTNVIAPSADAGADVYAAAIALLNEAIAQLNGTVAAAPRIDNFYGGDAAKWSSLANTLILRAGITTRLVDPAGAAAAVSAAVSSPAGLIDSRTEDWQFNYGTTRQNPNSRHPQYNASYETTDGAYMSNYYMWLLRAEKDNGGVPVIDPRIRYYFYRQVEDASAQDVTTYSCHWSNFPDPAQKPDWYSDVDPDMPYCVAFPGDGYWGRDHLNNEGIPPDGPLRTVVGIYPFGGQFDFNEFEDQQQQGTTGATGQGIWPIMTSSYVNFLRAEAALTVSTGEDARALFEAGMRDSFAKVIGFEARDPGTFSTVVEIRGGGSGTVKELYGADDADVDNYVNFVLGEYDAAASTEERLNIVMKEYYIALWGNGVESYNMYRRTGMPNNMQPGLESAPGAYMRSFFYPADHETRNPNVTQKQITDPVFWDNGSANVY